MYSDPQGVVQTDGDAVRAAQNFCWTLVLTWLKQERMCASILICTNNLGLYSKVRQIQGKDQGHLILRISVNVKENHAALVNAFSVPFFNLFMDKSKA